MNRKDKLPHSRSDADADAEAVAGAEEPGTARHSNADVGSQVINKSLRLPHERDQSTDAVSPAPQDVMIQAKKDIDAGLVDTDMRATPGLDADRREALVPVPVEAPRTNEVKGVAGSNKKPGKSAGR